MTHVQCHAIFEIHLIFFQEFYKEAESEDSGTIDGIEWELKDGVLTIRGEGALRETPWSENVDCIQKVVILSLKINNQMMGNTFQSIKKR